MKTEVDMRVLHLQAKEYWDGQPSPEARRKAWKRFSVKALRRNQLSQQHDF